ncbi:MAG: transketolase [Frankiaceae bacterium]|nr:transketolase [Frankiaceae bacterium]
MLASDPTRIAEWRTLRASLAGADAATRARLLAEAADASRRLILRTISKAGLGHVGGDLSVIDILTCLYGAVLSVDPADPTAADRDRFILSKGHCAGALYVTLAQTGFFSPDELVTFMAPLSPLNGHPDRSKVPGVETNTGPLGHGLPVAVGTAIAAKLVGSARRVYVVLGDGELQEGSNWEAAMAAGHRHLDNLVAVVDRNRLQQGAGTEETNALEPLADKWRAFGWRVEEVDGHDHGQLVDALTAAREGRPTCLVAHTIKGKGVSFMEGRVEWHHKVPSQEQVDAGLAELTR